MYGWFLKAKEQGLIRHIVFSSHMPGADIAEVIGEGLFEGVLLGYNALNYRYRQSGITAAAGQSMGVAGMNPLGGGLIPQNPELFAFLTEGTELTVPQAALRFVASHREVSARSTASPVKRMWTTPLAPWKDCRSARRRISRRICGARGLTIFAPAAATARVARRISQSLNSWTPIIRKCSARMPSTA
jgi:hypothetical protein